MHDMNEVINQTGNKGFMVAGYSNDHNVEGLCCANKGDAYMAARADQIVFRVSGRNGYRYKNRTKSLINQINSFKPDVIHLQNIHGDWINLEILFSYIKGLDIPIVWTIHDCWAFTGRCAYFELCGCEKWKSGCFACKNKNVYPITYFFDYSSSMFVDKYKWFRGIKKAILVTPSEWMAKYVMQSFLGDYDVKVINNGIDTNIFYRRVDRSKYVKKIKNKKIILGVAYSWSTEKGLDDVIRLDKLIDHDKYQIIIVGLNSRQLKRIPKTIIGLNRTNNQDELAELYSSADVFINPTYQDNFPTTNIEAQACGTVALTYDTGGSPESIISDEYVGQPGDINWLHNMVLEVCNHKKLSYTEIECFASSHFNKYDKFAGYIELYRSLVQ